MFLGPKHQTFCSTNKTVLFISLLFGLETRRHVRQDRRLEYHALLCEEAQAGRVTRDEDHQ